MVSFLAVTDETYAIHAAEPSRATELQKVVLTAKADLQGQRHVPIDGGRTHADRRHDQLPLARSCDDWGALENQAVYGHFASGVPFSQRAA